MGLFDRFFSADKGEQRFVNRHVTRILNKFGQKEIRQESLHILAQRGTPEAISGLLQRLTYNHTETIIDSKEKYLVLDLLDQLGPSFSTEPLLGYLKNKQETEISMALLALERLEGPDRTCQEILWLLGQESPDDHWNSQRKLQLVNQLDNYEDKSIIPVLIEYVEDINDDVIFRCVEILEKLGEDDEIREPLLQVLIAKETSMRIRDRVIEVARARKWHLGGYRKELENKLPEGYYFDKRDNLKKRGF